MVRKKFERTKPNLNIGTKAGIPSAPASYPASSNKSETASTTGAAFALQVTESNDAFFYKRGYLDYSGYWDRSDRWDRNYSDCSNHVHRHPAIRRMI